MHRFDLRRQFEHLLLAVAGGFGDHRLGQAEKGTGPLEDVAVARFDQRAEVGGEDGFGAGDGPLGEGAEHRRDKVHRLDQFDRGVTAVDADDATAFFLLLLHGVQHPFGRGTVHAVVHQGSDCHCYSSSVIGIFHFRAPAMPPPTPPPAAAPPAAESCGRAVVPGAPACRGSWPPRR